LGRGARVEGIQVSRLLNMLTEDTVALGVSVDSWQGAVHAVGKLLVESGSVEPRYVPAMVDMVEDIGPYIVITPGVALPHARPQDGVKRPCMGLITLSTSVNFGNEHNDPVWLVVAFGAPDSTGHLEALRDLARLLGDTERLEELRVAASVKEVRKIIGGASLQ